MISPGCEAIGSPLPSTEHSTSSPRAAASTIASGSCANAVSSAAGNSSAAAHSHDSNRGAEPRRLDKRRQAQAREVRAAPLGIRPVLSDPQRAVSDLGNPRLRHQLLEEDLVHAQRRGEHAGADVRHVEAFEQALHGAVLAERSVQHGEHDVGAVASRGRAASATVRPSSRQTPSRPISIRRTSCPASSSPSATEAADASETSCSEERPPPRTATRRELIWWWSCSWSCVVRCGCVGRRRGRLRVVADHDRDPASLRLTAARGRVLADHDPALRRVGDVLALLERP